MIDSGAGARGSGRSAVVLAAWAAWAAGCQSSKVETTTRNLDRGIDVALLCAVGETGAGGTAWRGAPLERCAEDGEGAGDLFAFVVQSTRGELAAINLHSLRMLDLDPRRPLHSPVAVGPLPNSIAVAPDGSWIVVANLGDPNPGEDPTNPEGRPYLSVLRPEWVLPQRSRDADRIYLPAPAAVVSFLDATHLVASLPSLAAVTVVTVGDEPSVAEPTVLEPFPLLDSEGRPQDGLPTPWSVLVDPGRERVLVGDRNAARLAVLAWDDHFALRVTGMAQVSGPVRAMDIEPVRDGGLAGRWIYAADGRSGGVMVLDAETLRTLDLALRDPLEWRAELFVPGVAQDVVVGRVALANPPETPNPDVLHGTFAFLVSSIGEVYVADIEDRSDPGCWAGGVVGEGEYLGDRPGTKICPRHVLRSASAPPAPPPAGTTPAQVPSWSSAPTLTQATEAMVPYTEAPPAIFPRFRDFSATDDWGNPTYGVRFDPDPRRALNQTWTIEYEGVLPYTDGTAGNVEAEGWLTDRAMPFCARGVLAGDHLTILDAPAPLDPTADCDAYGGEEDEERREYRIAEARTDRLRLEALSGGAPLPTEECYPYAVRYRIRVSGQWLVQGSAIPFQHHGVEDGGVCVESPDAAACPVPRDCTEEPAGDFRCLNRARATEGEVFRNPWICFVMESGTNPTPRGLRYELKAVGGFEPLVATAGDLPVAAVLDASRRTGPALLVLDAATDGLSRIDLDGFEVTDSWP